MGPQRIIAVGGGKGGVGKSVLALNIAVALTEYEPAVTLVDADLGMANQHTLLGIDSPARTLHDFTSRAVASLAETLVPTPIKGLSLVAGGTGHPDDANIKWATKQKLVRHIRALPSSTVIVDVGAGVHYNTIDLFDVADIRLAVVLNQLVSVQNAYAFFKASVFRTIRRAAQTPGQRELFKTVQEGRPAERLTALVQRLAHLDPEYGRAIRQALGCYASRLIGNQLKSPREEGVLFAMSRMVRDFLGVEAPVLGYLMASPVVDQSVSERQPVLVRSPESQEALNIRRMAESLLEIDVAALRADRVEPEIEESDPGDSEDPEAPLPEALDSIQRRHRRYDVEWFAHCVTANGKGESVILNISRSGALLETELVMEQGQTLLVQIETSHRQISARATVRNVRSDGRRYGVEFEEQDVVPIPEES